MGIEKPKKINASDPFPVSLNAEQVFDKRSPVLFLFDYALAKAMQPRPKLFQGMFGSSNKLMAAECGVYRAQAIKACAELIKRADVNAKIIGLDTFTGFPEITGKDLTYDIASDFSDNSIQRIKQDLLESGLSDYIELVQGRFSDTLKRLPETTYFFVNIDCDLYEPHFECLEYFYPRLAKGAVMFFDDYESVYFPLAKKAIDEFFSDKLERLFFFRHGDDRPNHTKAFIVKA